jgi:RNA polymerase sigma factor (TIGR02999 family)
MSDVTRILEAIGRGDPEAAAQLFPLVYEELRRMAAAQMARERPGHTLDPTALVHEAYLRLVGDPSFANRRHFFAAAAAAMGRILVESARRKRRLRHGGEHNRVELPADVAAPERGGDDVLAIHEALEQLAQEDAATAELVQLHYFAGLTVEQAAELLGLSPRTAYRNWAFARAWLYRRLGGDAAAEA